MISALAPLQSRLAEVELVMAEALACDEPRVSLLIAELGSFHGKLLRPALALLVADCLGGSSPKHIRIGAALELIHTASLIHDDLIDDADTRRGAPSAHLRFGNTTAVLLGDYFHTHAIHLVADLDDPAALRRVTATTNTMCLGELHQQCAARDARVDEVEYYRIIYAKTACLTELAAELGASAGSAEHRQAAAAFGRACGLAFQIVDDCLDFSGDPRKVGKTLATDLERGRLTLPVIRWLARGGRSEQLAMAADPASLPALRREIAGSGVLAACIETAREHIRQADAQLTLLPPDPARERLRELATFIVARDF